ncbi:hypothetical protein BD770DRAFT_474113 [Pilaira anomala]|nr:hypothetical protein BD770DRAFT_474113 [Pilaira anomala]
MEAGFDSVEIHDANGYLLYQFVNTMSNKCNDKSHGDVIGNNINTVDTLEPYRKIWKACSYFYLYLHEQASTQPFYI